MQYSSSMKPSDRSIVITRYILGQLSEEEQARLEEEYRTDSDLFEEIVAVENDLIDSYVAGKLSGANLRQFESHFLTTPEHQERVAFAKFLADSGPQQETSNPSSVEGSLLKRLPSPFSLSLAAVLTVLLLLASSIWLAIRDIRLRHELAEMRSSQGRIERERQEFEKENAELQAELARRRNSPIQGPLPVGPPGQSATVLTLSADLARGPAAPNVLPLSSGINTVILMLQTGRDPYSDYEISLETPDRIQLLRKKGLDNWVTHQGRLVAVQLPAAAFQRGDYVLRLIGMNPTRPGEEIDAYSFRVITGDKIRKSNP